MVDPVDTWVRSRRLLGAWVVLTLALATGTGIALYEVRLIRTELRDLRASLVRPTGPPARRSEPAVPREPISIASAVSRGLASAPVVAIEFSDFDCPFCARFASTTFGQLDEQYIRSGQVQWVFRHLPIAELHPNAPALAELAACAAEVGKFWSAHDFLFSTPKSEPARSTSAGIAKAIGVNDGRLAACLQSGSGRAAVSADLNEAHRLGFAGTPAFLFGLRQADGTVQAARALSGARPIAEFRGALDGLLAVVER